MEGTKRTQSATSVVIEVALASVTLVIGATCLLKGFNDQDLILFSIGLAAWTAVVLWLKSR